MIELPHIGDRVALIPYDPDRPGPDPYATEHRPGLVVGWAVVDSRLRRYPHTAPDARTLAVFVPDDDRHALILAHPDNLEPCR